uniref:Secreted protein n=1 Tax=Anopheles coluzzii TaxID=1518534 RepID=A0A6E8W5Y4_ANOCL
MAWVPMMVWAITRRLVDWVTRPCWTMASPTRTQLLFRTLSTTTVCMEDTTAPSTLRLWSRPT